MNVHRIKNNLWNKNNFSYKKNHSTIHALIDMLDHWTTNIDNQFQNINMFLDLSAAFDPKYEDL